MMMMKMGMTMLIIYYLFSDNNDQHDNVDDHGATIMMLQCATVFMHPRASKCEVVGWAAAMMMMKMIMTMIIII